jgi:radical SAM protein with 4Fe4S-binding SPASM domain
MSPELAQELLSMHVQLVVKMNSLSNEVQDRLAGVAGAGAKIKQTLSMLQEVGYNQKNLLGIESIICKQNYDEIPEMWRWARDRNIIPYFEMITFQGRAKGYDLNVSIDDLQDLFNRLLAIDEEHYGYTWNPHPPIAGLSCQRHLYNVVITSNGYVYPCVGVNIRLGNIRHQNLGEIIANSPILKSLRNLKENIHGSCKSCKLNVECYGCRGMAYHLTGDCFASDPLCWFNEKKITIQEDGTIKTN